MVYVWRVLPISRGKQFVPPFQWLTFCTHSISVKAFFFSLSCFVFLSAVRAAFFVAARHVKKKKTKGVI